MEVGQQTRNQSSTPHLSPLPELQQWLIPSNFGLPEMVLIRQQRLRRFGTRQMHPPLQKSQQLLQIHSTIAEPVRSLQTVPSTIDRSCRPTSGESVRLARRDPPRRTITIT